MNPITQQILQFTKRMLSRGAQHLLDLLRWYSSKFRRVHPSQAKLGSHLHVSISTVKRWLLELKRIGAVAVQKYGRQAAEIEFNKAVLAQIDAEENERSTSGLRAVCERSVSGQTGATISASLSTFPSYIQNVSKKTHTQPQRKPPQKEDVFDRALAMMLAKGYK